mmetsp:Transcript_386/g.723  ORF Transcript_386/g.723 Transcript_386/m.723 type:complete len:252 (+) Transcript_386:132-887(+)
MRRGDAGAHAQIIANAAALYAARHLLHVLPVNPLRSSMAAVSRPDTVDARPVTFQTAPLSALLLFSRSSESAPGAWCTCPARFGSRCRGSSASHTTAQGLRPAPSPFSGRFASLFRMLASTCAAPCSCSPYPRRRIRCTCPRGSPIGRAAGFSREEIIFVLRSRNPCYSRLASFAASRSECLGLLAPPWALFSRHQPSVGTCLGILKCRKQACRASHSHLALPLAGRSYPPPLLRRLLPHPHPYPLPCYLQ